MARVPGASGTSTTRSTFAGISGQTTPEAMALWLLVGLEVLSQVWLRHYFRRHHGG
jgi:hypothetical protein